MTTPNYNALFKTIEIKLSCPQTCTSNCLLKKIPAHQSPVTCHFYKINHNYIVMLTEIFINS